MKKPIVPRKPLLPYPPIEFLTTDKEYVISKIPYDESYYSINLTEFQIRIEDARKEFLKSLDPSLKIFEEEITVERERYYKTD